MIKKIIVLCLLLCGGCATIKEKLPDIFDKEVEEVYTNKPVAEIIKITDPISLNASASWRAETSTGQGSIIVDNDLIPHVLLEQGRGFMYGSLNFDESRWELTAYSTMDKYNNSQMANSRLYVDLKNNIVWGYGYGWFPHNAELNVFAVPECNKLSQPSVFKRYRIHAQNAGSASFDKYLKQFIVTSHQFQFVALEYDDNDIKELYRGGYSATSGGEKEDFYVSKAGKIKHADGVEKAMWIYGTDSRFQNSLRGSNNKRDLVWSDWDTYLAMWDDMCYMSLRCDNVEPGTAYFAAGYGSARWELEDGTVRTSTYRPGIYMNIWKTDNMQSGDGHFVFDIKNLFLVDGNGRAFKREPPQLAEAKYGGVFISYLRGGHGIIKYIPSNITKEKQEGIKEFDIGAGAITAITVDKDGNLHLLQTGAGSIEYYRKIIFYEESNKGWWEKIKGKIFK